MKAPQFATPETSGRLSTSVTFSDLISGIVWVASVSYNWFMVSKVTFNQLKHTKIRQTIPDILASNASAQSSRSFSSGQLERKRVNLGKLTYCNPHFAVLRAGCSNISQWIFVDFQPAKLRFFGISETTLFSVKYTPYMQFLFV